MSSGSLFSRRHSRVPIALLALFTGAISVYGQSYYGALRGNVVDANGGALVTAKVTLTNEGTSCLLYTSPSPRD